MYIYIYISLETLHCLSDFDKQPNEQSPFAIVFVSVEVYEIQLKVVDFI